MDKKKWVGPELAEYGSVEALTKGDQRIKTFGGGDGIVLQVSPGVLIPLDDLKPNGS